LHLIIRILSPIYLEHAESRGVVFRTLEDVTFMLGILHCVRHQCVLSWKQKYTLFIVTYFHWGNSKHISMRDKLTPTQTILLQTNTKYSSQISSNNINHVIYSFHLHAKKIEQRLLE